MKHRELQIPKGINNETIKDIINKNKNNTEINSNNYIEEYDSTTNECSILVDITQKKYFCDGFRKTFETFIRTKTVNETSCKDDDIITEKNRVCYLNYQKCQNQTLPDCAGPPPLKCAFILLKPEKQCYSEEEQKEYGFGEQCRVISESSNALTNFEFIMNCTHGVATTSSFQHNSRYYDSIIDYSPVGEDRFWMRDTNNLIYLPFDPNITVSLRVRDFKYLSHSYDQQIKVNDTDFLIGKKQMNFNIDAKSLPKTAKPGGKMFVQMDVDSPHLHIDEIDRSIFLEIAEYTEPPYSNPIFVFNTTTTIIMVVLFLFLWVCIYRWNNRRTKRKLIFDESKDH